MKKKCLSILLSLCVIVSAFSVSSFTAFAKTCSRCSGRGVAKCTLCSGSGQFYEYDVMKDDFTWNKCIRCKGSGYIRCPECNGSGRKGGSSGSKTSSSSSSSSFKPSATSISKLTTKKNGFSVKWKKKTNKIAGYQVQYSTKKNFKSKTSKNISGKSKTSTTVSGLKSNKTYYVRVRTYAKIKGKKKYSSWSGKKSVVTSPVAKPKATSVTKAVARNNGFIVTWNKQTKNNSGYQLQYSTDSNFKNRATRTINNKNTTSLTLSGLSDQKRYYVRVRTFRSANGKKYCSSWSKVKSVVTGVNPYSPSKTPGTTSIKVAVITYGGREIIIDFKHVNNCTGYQVQFSRSSDFSGSSTHMFTCPYNNGDLPNRTYRYETYQYGQWYWWLSADEDGYYSANVYNGEAANAKYYRMRTYSSVNGKVYYGKWSNIASL